MLFFAIGLFLGIFVSDFYGLGRIGRHEAVLANRVYILDAVTGKVVDTRKLFVEREVTLIDVFWQSTGKIFWKDCLLRTESTGVIVGIKDAEVV